MSEFKFILYFVLKTLLQKGQLAIFSGKSGANLLKMASNKHL